MSKPKALPADWTPVGVLTLVEARDRYIKYAIDRCGGNLRAAARTLGIGRTSLYRYLKKLRREKEAVQPGPELNARNSAHRRTYPTTNQRGQSETSATACLEK